MRLKRLMHKKRHLLNHAVFKATVIIGLSAIVIGFLIYFLEAKVNNNFSSISDGIWWFFVTISTVGYGDKVPSTGLGRFLAIVVMLFGVAILSVITATISSIFVTQKLREGKGLHELKLNNHLLICGWSRHCDEILTTLEKRSKEFSTVVLINQLPEETIEEILARYEKIDLRFVRGDFTKESILLRASAKQAKAAIIVPDISNPMNKQSDERTILATLTLKTLNTKINVVAHIIDPENYAHLNKARADEIVVSDAFTGHILAHHILTPGIPRFWEQVFNEDSPVALQQYPIPKSLVGSTYLELTAHCRQIMPDGILLGLVEMNVPFDLNSLLSSDYSYLDEFILRKFKEAGLGSEQEKKVKIQLAPRSDTILNESQYYLVLERKKS